MRIEPLIAFTLFAIVTTVTPGPNNVMLTATGANVGVRRGLPHLFGVAFGFAFMLALLTVTIGTALTDSPRVLFALRIAGVAVLLWLSWKIATASRNKEAARERPIGFFDAVLFQWVNPKAWLICAGAVSFIQPDGPPAYMQAASSAPSRSFSARPACCCGSASARRCSGCFAPTARCESLTSRWGCSSPRRCRCSSRALDPLAVRRPARSQTGA